MAALGAAASAPVAAADLVVLESGAPTYPAGRTMSATTPIKLAAGEFVVVVTEDARLVRIAGPHDGPAVGTSPDESAVRKAIDRLVSADQPRVGGVGAVRGGEESAAEADTRPGPWLLHAQIDGEQCALRDRSIELWRERTATGASAQITSAENDAVVAVSWAEGAGRAAWPTDVLPAIDDRIYLVRFDGATRSVAIRVRLLEPAVASNGLAAAAWLAAKGCTAQARLALR
ncbi:MAG TPA: hypothetical protein VMU03_00295 [Gammaproteobacteria bacterium]|nr:hypothetical protein [Gammaproteobacteria bacterium]